MENNNQLNTTENNQLITNTTTNTAVTTTREEQIIPLLEERLLVDRIRRRVGEVVLRKKVETRMVEVPVRWEKLIIEEVSGDRKQLAEINLGEGEITGIDLRQIIAANADRGHSVSGEFVSLKAASDFLEAIALKTNNGCSKVKIEIMVEDPQAQENYQKMLDRASNKKS
jgi:Domain of unknown function (DUF2382)